MSRLPVERFPYEEVSFRWQDDFTRLIIETGWVTVTARLQGTSIGWARRIIERLPTSDESSQQFFSVFADYPLFYYRPRKIPAEGKYRDATEQGLRWLNTAVTSRWEIGAWLENCRIGRDAFDPLSVLSSLRRFHLRDLARSLVTRQLHEKLESLASCDKERFVRAVASIVKQNHFVTENAEAAVTPALELYPPTREPLDRFLASERNHSSLLANSLSALGKKPAEEARVTSEFIELMDHLRLAAGSSVLGITAILDTFEAASRGAEDPLAKLLERENYKSVARGLKRHHVINKTHAHHEFAETLLQFLPPVDEKSVLLAARLAERNTYLQIRGCERLVETI